MNIPNEVKFGGHTIRVRVVTSEELGEETLGTWNERTKLIMLDGVSDISETTKAETFLHELIEFVKSWGELDIEHKDLTILSGALFAIMRDNKIDFTDTREWKEAD